MEKVLSPALALFTKVLNDIPFNQILGLRLAAIETDYLLMRFSMKPELIGNYMYSILHGGVISSVLDMAGGAAAMVSAIRKHPDKNLDEIAAFLAKTSTINLHIDYIQPGRGHEFTAKASVLHSGNKVTFTRMELHNQESLLIASATATYMISP